MGKGCRHIQEAKALRGRQDSLIQESQRKLKRFTQEMVPAWYLFPLYLDVTLRFGRSVVGSRA